jgi:hypothetical protein
MILLKNNYSNEDFLNYLNRGIDGTHKMKKIEEESTLELAKLFVSILEGFNIYNNQKQDKKRIFLNGGQKKQNAFNILLNSKILLIDGLGEQFDEIVIEPLSENMLYSCKKLNEKLHPELNIDVEEDIADILSS